MRKRRAADSGSSSPSKRSWRSSSTSFGSGVQTQVKRMYGDRCWHCRAHKLNEMAHVFAKADGTFAQSQELGLVDLEHVGQAKNALPLCPSCHSAMDMNNVLLIIVPYDMQYFIDKERSWQAMFATSARQRPALMADYQAHCFRHYLSEFSHDDSSGPAGLYQCYMVKEFFHVSDDKPTTRPCKLQRTRIWRDDPKAVLRRALKQI
jgi:hypothetical protein